MQAILSIIIILIFLFIIQKIILLFQFKISKAGFDHFFHFALIQEIKNNKNKFVLTLNSFIVYDNFMYPQLYHWLLSFLPEKFIREKYNKVGQFINFLTIATFVIFAYSVYDFLDLQISRELFVLYSGLAFTLSPFNYLLWNAKNRGLSVRGFGLLLGFLYLYCIVWLNLYENNWFYLPIYFIVFIILLSNQFSFQFVLLSSPFLAIFYKDIFLVFPPFVAALLFLIFFRKIAVSFFKGQYYHKYNFATHLGKVYFLNHRPSIWRDLLWDFWKKRNIKYILNNSIVNIIVGIPTIVGIVCFILFQLDSEMIIHNKLLIISLTPLIVFFLTSFKYTRFLGEPERYVEFGIPIYSVLYIYFFQNQTPFIILLLVLSFISIIYHFSIFFNQNEGSLSVYATEIKEAINKTNNDKNSVYLFSNNIAYLNFFIDEEKYKILSPNITDLKTYKYTIKDVYPVEFPIVNSQILSDLIIYYNIDFFILETNRLSEHEFEKLVCKDVSIEKFYNKNEVTLYQIKKQTDQ